MTNPSRNTPETPNPAHSNALSIVSLDDDADFRQFIQTVLGSDSGGAHTVRTASTPEEFFALCEDRLPDLVLLDMKMGHADGANVLAEIRRRWPKLCVIIVTGYPSLDSMRETFKQDVFDYLAKPFSLDELRRTLDQAASVYGLGMRSIDRLKAELGKQIRLARTQRGWTLKDLSEASEISVSQLSAIERGSHLPSVESLVAVAAAMDCRPSEWFRAGGM